jgi:hypothetical protein
MTLSFLIHRKLFYFLPSNFIFIFFFDINSRLTTDSLNDSSPSSFIRNNESHIITAISPPTWRVKLKKPFVNGSDDEYIQYEQN